MVLGFFVACSSGIDKPPPSGNPDGSTNVPEATVHEDAAALDASGIADTGFLDVAAIPKTCFNTIRDGQETDVDCGGPECPKCIDSKMCVADSDCAGKSCVNKICTTANCKDGITNGDESDVDCGGTVCAKCTIGKRCKAPTDCGSLTCGADQACACPPAMAAVAKSNGGAYCIDQTEITKGQYNKFLTANVPVGDQTGACGPPSAGMPPANANFVPRGAWPPATQPLAPQAGIAFSMGLPVHYVDWCDAAAYCKWSNKQLCGKINGGTLPQVAANDAAQSSWYNACSAQGTKGWPYSTVFDASKCNGSGIGNPGVYQGPLNTQQNGFGFGGANQDTGVYDIVVSDASGNIVGQATHHSGCQGGSVNVYQMSGNVAEWEDSCSGDTATSSCNVRGGSYAANDTAATLRCDAPRTEVRLPADGNVLADVGFRCCLY